jgi:FMN phosphatase YigB (HAD superfamily)
MQDSWYVFLSYFQPMDQASATLAFGCCAQSRRAPEWRAEDTISVAGTGALLIHQMTVRDEAIQPFLVALSTGVLNPALLGVEQRPKIEAKDSFSFIGEVFGHGAARCRAYCTVPDLYEMFGESIAPGMRPLLDALQKQLGLPFAGDYAGHFGNFEVFGLASWRDAPSPFLIDISRVGNQGAEADSRFLRINRSREFASSRHSAHVIFRSRGLLLLDRLLLLPARQARSAPLACPGPFDELEAWIFDAGGALIHHERNTYLRSIVMNQVMAGREIVIQGASGRRAGKDQQAEHVQHYSTHTSHIDFGDDGPWRDYAEQLDGLFRERVSDDRFFLNEIGGDWTVVRHLNQLCRNAEIKTAWLVDPYVDIKALARLLRLERSDMRLRVISNADGDLLEGLKRGLQQLRDAIAPQLNLRNIGGKDAFHDRYLVLCCDNRPPRVFLLSNSLNNAGGSHPFCLSRLSGPAAEQAFAYLQALWEGRDLSGRKQPTFDFIWPENAA